MMKFDDNAIWLDVGGTHHIKTGLDILTSVEGSLLKQMFSGRHELKRDHHGKIFVDRDGETFLALINYLRNDRKDVPVFENIHKY